MGGAAAFSDMQRGNVLVLRASEAGLQQHELSRRVGAETSTALAAHLAFWPNRHWGLRLQGTYSPTRFETMMKESEAQFAGLSESADEETRLAGLSVMTGDLQLLFRLPTIRNRVMPYGIVGGGVTRYSVQSGDEPVPEEAAGEFESGSKVRTTGSFGVGAMLPLRNRDFRMHFELTNHMTSTPLRGNGDGEVHLTNSVRFMVGFSFSPKG